MTTSSGLTTARTPDGSEKFIEEGAVSYVQATIAIKEFARVIQEECEKIAVGRLDEINRSMGTTLSEEDLRYWPRKGRLLDPNVPWLCIWFTLKDIGALNLGFYWQSLPDGTYRLHAVAGLQFDEQRLFQGAREKSRGLKNSKFRAFPDGIQGNHLTISEPIPAEQTALFPKSIDSVLTGFLEECERIGGLQALKESRPKAMK